MSNPFRRLFDGHIRKAGSYVDGIYTPGDVVLISFFASVQPARGKDLEALPEGRRISDTVRVYTDSILPTAGDESGDAAFIRYRGRDYELVHCDTWDNNVINHFKYLATRATPDEGGAANGAG